MIESIIDLKTKKVEEIMVKANKIYSLDISTKTSKILAKDAFDMKKFSRIPVFKKNKNNIIGILLI
jgi:CBS domain containing-hemolysin-like protein